MPCRYFIVFSSCEWKIDFYLGAWRAGGLGERKADEFGVVVGCCL